MGASKSILSVTVAVFLVAFVGEFAGAIVYENKAVCEQFFYDPFRNVDYCLNCCKEAGYTEKGQKDGENASCSCKGERANPDGADVPVKPMAAPDLWVYENSKVCRQFRYYPNSNVDQCMQCCKQAGYTDKGEKDYDSKDGPCTCEIEQTKDKKRPGDILIAGQLDAVIDPKYDGKATEYENSVICRKMDYRSRGSSDVCLDCCKRNGYTEKGKLWSISYNGPCSCKATKLRRGRNDLRVVSTTY